MLSGDNQRTVDVIAKQAGIDEAHGDLLPDQKVERVRELTARHRHVGMIGDGVNDAPAMAVATVGIAMGAAGTDTALETADMALMQDDLNQVAASHPFGPSHCANHTGEHCLCAWREGAFPGPCHLGLHQSVAGDSGGYRRNAGGHCQLAATAWIGF